ncbi:MAG: hypothetical protein JWO06_2203 [Bacteroidota bacterium]|nr:hypothetical protein [Bacteroidota bacterium]
MHFKGKNQKSNYINHLLVFAFCFFAMLTIAGCKASNPGTSVNTAPKLILSMDRHGCFGRCPIYIIRVYDNGLFYYEGVRYTDTTGKFCSMLDKREFSELLTSVKAAKLFDMGDVYPEGKPTPADLPSVVVTYTENDRTKRIVDNGRDRPDALVSLEQMLDATVKSRKLQSCDK